MAAKYHFLPLWVDELLTSTTKNTHTQKTLVACVSGGPRIHNAALEQNVSFTQHSPELQFFLIGENDSQFFEDLVIF